MKKVIAGLVATGLIVGMPGIALADESESESASSQTSSSSKSKSSSSSKSKSKDGEKDEGKCVIAIDPGHNSEKIEEHDEETGIFQYDYPNGKEDKDVWEVSVQVAKGLKKEGHKPVILRKKMGESVDYRTRVDRAETVKADVAVSVHTTPGVDYSMIIAQKEGGYREGADSEGNEKRVEFGETEVAEKSKELSEIVAEARTEAEPNPVKVVEEHSFEGREPMWGGNMPIVSLMSENVPWLYSEYGTDEGGGEQGISKDDKKAYTEGLTKGLLNALEDMDCGDAGDDDDDSDSSPRTSEPSSKPSKGKSSDDDNEDDDSSDSDKSGGDKYDA